MMGESMEKYISYKAITKASYTEILTKALV